VAPFLDLHLVIPLLEFVQPRKVDFCMSLRSFVSDSNKLHFVFQVYNDDSLFKTHRSVLLKTNMIDSVIEMYSEDQVPEDLLKRRDQVLEERDQLKAKCDPVVKILELDDVKAMMDSARDREGNSKVLEYITEKHAVCFDL
jgi:translation initiation factor 3 subunit E